MHHVEAAASARTVGSLVAENIHLAQVFTRYGIDFCCKGGQTLEAAATAKGIPVDQLLADIQRLMPLKKAGERPENGVGPLIEDILMVHHGYVTDTLPVLRTLLDQVTRLYAPNHPELFTIRALFDQVATEVYQHMIMEEQVIFPFILHIEEALQGKTVFQPAAFGHIDCVVSVMEHEHRQEGERFARIAELSGHYRPPAQACQNWQMVYEMLEEFEEDLHIHIHLENNVLFPMARQMYDRLVAKDQ